MSLVFYDTHIANDTLSKATSYFSEIVNQTIFNYNITNTELLFLLFEFFIVFNMPIWLKYFYEHANVLESILCECVGVKLAAA